MLSRPAITDGILAQIRKTINDNPDWGRRRISIHLCELWDWRIPGGPVKDISCRDMLRALDKAGLIKLPMPRAVPAMHPRRSIAHLDHDTKPVTCGLAALRPLSVVAVERGEDFAEFKSLIDQYHYLGYDRTIGENMKYVVRSNDGILLACLMFGSAAWKCRGRDDFIGWDHGQRNTGLAMMSNNSRFMVAPWIRVPHLASHILGLISRRISSDWEIKYGHDLVAIETFVERDRFRGVCYQAANWICVGKTTGRGRNDRTHERALPVKDIYLLPLTRKWRERLLTQ